MKYGQCIDCKTEENIIHSGVDAFMYGVSEHTGMICSACALKRYKLAVAK